MRPSIKKTLATLLNRLSEEQEGDERVEGEEEEGGRRSGTVETSTLEEAANPETSRTPPGPPGPAQDVYAVG